MSGHSGICVVWPAWFEGSTDPELHVTALFLGNLGMVDYEAEEVLNAMGRFMGTPPGTVGLFPGIDWFGQDNDIPVMRLYTLFNPHLNYQRSSIQKNLWDGYGIGVSTEYPFRPHITMANEKFAAMPELPREVHLEPPVLWWGDKRPIHTKHRKELAA